MRANQLGLTKLYNALKDPSVDDDHIEALRWEHREMDAAVLAEYGWNDLKAPPFCAKSDADLKAQDAFKSKVIDRLYDLNAERAKQEELLGLRGKLKTPLKAKSKVVNPLDQEAANNNAEVSARKKAKVIGSKRPGPVSTRPATKPGKKAGGSR